MEFTYVSGLFQSLDGVITEFAINNIQQVTNYIVPIVGLGLTIALLIQGLATMLSPTGGEPLSSLLGRFIKYAVIVAIAGAGGLYQTEIASTLLNLPDHLSSSLYMGAAGGNPDNMGSVIDQAATQGGRLAMQAFDDIGWSFESLASAYIAIHMIICTFLMCGVGAAIIITAKFMLAILVGLGPFFIFALMFDSTKQLFTPWIGAVFNYIIVVALAAAIFSIMNTFYTQGINEAMNDDIVNNVSIIISSAIVVVVTLMLLFQIPSLAASLTSGIAVAMPSLYNQGMEAASGGGGASSGTEGGKAGGSRLKSAAKATGRGIGRAASAVGGAAGRAGAAALRYARQG